MRGPDPGQGTHCRASWPIARIIGIPEHAEAGLRGLIASGALSWSGDKPRYKLPVQLASGGASVSQMVLEDRR